MVARASEVKDGKLRPGVLRNRTLAAAAQFLEQWAAARYQALLDQAQASGTPLLSAEFQRTLDLADCDDCDSGPMNVVRAFEQAPFAARRVADLVLRAPGTSPPGTTVCAQPDLLVTDLLLDAVEALPFDPTFQPERYLSPEGRELFAAHWRLCGPDGRPLHPDP